ncbi:MAG: hypothetical protein ACSHWU_06620 [Marinicella sp.]
MQIKFILKIGLLILIIAFAIIRSWYGTRLDSFTVDEPYHVVAGVSYIKTGDYRLNPEHPPLTKLWVGLFNQSSFKLRDFKPLNDKFNERNFTEEIMYYDNDYSQVQQFSRWAMWSFNGILMLCLMSLVWRLISFPAACLVGALMSIEPTIAAHFPIVMTDLPVALALACCVMIASGLYRYWNLKWVLLMGMFSGAALAIKFSAITGLLSLFITLGLLALWTWHKEGFKNGMKQLSMVFVAGMIAVVLLWSTYGFQYHAAKDGTDSFNRTVENKIDDLASPHYQQILTTMDQLQVVPRAYIWGLADTIKAGVEGRGSAKNFIFGTMYNGETPWFYWPAVMLSKIPIPIQLLIVLSTIVFFYSMFTSTENHRRTIVPVGFLMVLLGAYFITLLSSQGTYAGIRHALPLTVVLLLFIAIIYQYIRSIKPLMTHASLGSIIILTLLMTISEKRVWEYHNEWVGGTENAYKYFYNEGLNLGQRTQEIINYIKANDLQDESFYRFTWLIEEELKAANINIPTIAKDIDDDNVKGAYEGFHLIEVSSLIKWEHWDPADIDHFVRVKRLGHVYIMQGSYEDPRDWAASMQGHIKEYLMVEAKPDWYKVVKRLEQIISIKDYQYDLHLQLGNAYIKIAERDKAIAAYQHAVELIDPSKLFKTKIEDQIVLLQSPVAIEAIPILRSDSIE